MTNSTFVGNGAGHGPGGTIHNSTGAVILTNTVIAPSVEGDNCAGTITDGGHNLDSDGTCGVGPATDSLLDPQGLADNGGPTQTIALQAGSPAINAGDETICAAPPVGNLDQRDFVRPGTGAANCSIGAYEHNSPGLPANYVGDCDGHGAVTVNELIMMVNIALGNAPLTTCTAGDADHSGEIGIDEILQAVSNALQGGAR